MIGVACVEIAAAIACHGIGVGLDDDALAGVLFLRKDQHFKERRSIRAALEDRGVVQGLIEHQHIARLGAGGVWIKAVVFAQMGFMQARDARARAVHQSGIVKRMVR